MVNRSLNLLLASLLLLMLFITPARADGLEASVDRSRLHENESLTLLLRAPGLQLTGEPELAELYQDFEVLAQQVRTNIQIVNGENRSERLWEISLLPKRSGTLIIPAISLGDARSQPITLEVRPAPENTRASADIFLHSELDQRDSIYVQQQLIYTLRLYYATSISDHGLTDLEPENVLMLQLGNRKDFEAFIDGRRYNVAEWQFALYPQRSGELVIPPQTFSGRVRMQNRYSLGGLKHIRIQSPGHRIQVKPVPDSFPAGAQWLPAKSLSLSQQWSGDFSQWQEGSPLTRTLTLQAEGLTAAQLPPLVLTPGDELRQYPEQPQQEDTPVNLNEKGAGIRGEKRVSIALIPTRAGPLQLQEVRIPWWNTETDQLEYARLDPLALDIQADPNRKPQSAVQDAAPADTPVAAPQDTSGLRFWQGTSLLLALLCTALGIRLWQAHKRYRIISKQLHHTPVITGSRTPEPAEENPIYRQALLNACQQNQARAAWDAWQKWQRAEAPATTADFDHALHQLQQTLFGPQAQPEHWQGADLARASEGVKQAQGRAASPLPELYPTAQL